MQKHDVRRLRLAVRAGHLPGLDGVEAVDPVLVGGGAAEPLELRVRQRAIVARIGVAALGIRLPDLDHGVVDRLAVAVEDHAFDADLVAGDVRRDQVVADRFLPGVRAVRVPLAAPLAASGHRRRTARRFARALCPCRLPAVDLCRPCQCSSLSSGVASRPRSTMSKRNANAQSGTVFSRSNLDTMRSRAFGSVTELKIGSNGKR